MPSGDQALWTNAVVAPWAYALTSGSNTGSSSSANNVTYTVTSTSPSNTYNAAQLIRPTDMDLSVGTPDTKQRTVNE